MTRTQHIHNTRTSIRKLPWLFDIDNVNIPVRISRETQIVIQGHTVRFEHLPQKHTTRGKLIHRTHNHTLSIRTTKRDQQITIRRIHNQTPYPCPETITERENRRLRRRTTRNRTKKNTRRTKYKNRTRFSRPRPIHIPVISSNINIAVSRIHRYRIQFAPTRTIVRFTITIYLVTRDIRRHTTKRFFFTRRPELFQHFLFCLFVADINRPGGRAQRVIYGKRRLSIRMIEFANQITSFTEDLDVLVPDLRIYIKVIGRRTVVYRKILDLLPQPRQRHALHIPARRFKLPQRTTFSHPQIVFTVNRNPVRSSERHKLAPQTSRRDFFGFFTRARDLPHQRPHELR